MYQHLFICTNSQGGVEKEEEGRGATDKMDANYSKAVQSLFPMETRPSQVSDEAFNLFHSIDRELYARLIHTLGRDPIESVRVMAFCMWLERETKDMSFIKRLLSLPLALLNDVCEETVVCLRCSESDRFPLAGDCSEIVTLLPQFLSSRVNGINLRLIHENRVPVLRAVNKIINTVCARAFEDILQSAWRATAVDGGARVDRRIDGSALAMPPPPPVMYHSHLNVPFVHLPAVGAGLLPVPPPYDLGGHGQMKGGNRQGDCMERSLSKNNRERPEENANNGDGDGSEVPADDRTIFLTFSKGYPITEDEVREYFTRIFGDFIECLIMQDHVGNEQVLYAKMVAQSNTGVIDEIVGGNKAKYIINGKHVWARKYVKKKHRWPQAPRGEDVDHFSPFSSTVRDQ